MLDYKPAQDASRPTEQQRRNQVTGDKIAGGTNSSWAARKSDLQYVEAPRLIKNQPRSLESRHAGK
jgi:hypothetical protein